MAHNRFSGPARSFFFQGCSRRPAALCSIKLGWTETVSGAIIKQAKHKSLSLAFHRCPQCSQIGRVAGRGERPDLGAVEEDAGRKGPLLSSDLRTAPSSRAPLPCQSQGKNRACLGPAVGRIHMELPGPGMNSEWSGCCWNLPPSLCVQDDQRQEGAFADGRGYKQVASLSPRCQSVYLSLSRAGLQQAR